METAQVTVGAIMTAPRYEAVWVRTEIQRALGTLGIPLNVTQGVFYGQCMQNMLEKLVRDGAQYALTIDFDSVFTPAHVNRLLSIVEQRRDIDALAAAQVMRGNSRFLGTTGKKEALAWSGDPLKMRSAHFGLTVIRLEKLASVPKPWFLAVPNDEGGWDGGTDDDVYFWRQWEKAGNSVYIDPGCRLGHFQEVITLYDEKGEIRHIYPNDWEAVSASSIG